MVTLPARRLFVPAQALGILLRCEWLRVHRTTCLVPPDARMTPKAT
jgi:hypothetical protein